MIIFTYPILRDFCEQYPDAEDALHNWRRIIMKGDFANFGQLKTFFNSVDAVGDDLFVFNIRGNKYRLVTRIHFNVRAVYIKFIGTHKQYDKLNFELL